MEKLKQMKEALVGCVEGQVYGNLQGVNAKELGEAMDMIKDLSEAIYYCTITEAMEKEEKEGKGKTHGQMYYDRNMVKPMYYMPYPIEYYDPRYNERYSMYNRGNGGSGSMSGSSSSNGGQGGGTSYASGDNGGNTRGGSRNYHDGMIPYRVEDYEMIRDPREGKSGWRRKMYMEGKATHKDKTKQMQELEEYMQELTSDMTEMIADASPEEKQMLQQKIAILAQKIK